MKVQRDLEGATNRRGTSIHLVVPPFLPCTQNPSLDRQTEVPLPLTGAGLSRETSGCMAGEIMQQSL